MMVDTCTAEEIDTGTPWSGGYDSWSGAPREEYPGPPNELPDGERITDYFFAFAEPGEDVASSDRALRLCWVTEEIPGQLVTHHSATNLRTFWGRRVECVDGSVYQLAEMMPEMLARCGSNWDADHPLRIDWRAEEIPVYDPHNRRMENQAEDEPNEGLKRAVIDALRTLLGHSPDDDSAL